jgi:hypothetical protein
MREIDKRKLTECASLSLATDSWIIWLDDQDGLDPHDSSEWGAYAISIDEWKNRVAERAVSPAESVQSIGSHAGFWQVVSNWAYSDEGDQMEEKARRMVAFVDSQIAKERASAHAEGRRSALEELHPQWLKEKERADRAEAKIPCTLGVGTGGGSLFVHGTYEAIKATQEWVLRAERAEAALAARQAPDLNKLICWVKDDEGDLCQAVERASGIKNPNEAFLRLSSVQSLLSSTAQPLQQEDGKGERAAFEAWQRKEQGWLYNEEAEPGTFQEDRWIAWKARAALAQPSGNLQQASTAQVEPAKEGVLEEAVESVECTSCGGRGRDSSEDNYGGDCPTCTGQGFVIAASATDATPKLPSTPEEIIDFIGVNFGRREKSPEKDDWCYTMSVHDLLSAFRDWQDFPAAQATPIDRDAVAAVQEKLDSLSVYRNDPAQATPEGADLPPRSELAAFQYWAACQNEPLTPIGAWEARAALASAAAVETVYQVRSMIAPDAWCDISKDHAEFCKMYGYDLRTLYRAAPPQQVAPMTPEMLRAVQLRSEVGTYITTNWANAYDCLQELWRVACEAQGKQVDTGGLPG